MASEWPVTLIGDVARSISETHKRTKQRLVFLNTSDILLGKVLHHEYTEVANWPGQAKKAITTGDILFSEIRPANGRWAFVDFDGDDYVVSTKLMVIRANSEQVTPKFLYQYLTSSETTRWLQHLAESRSGTFPQITFDQIAGLELPLPPIPEQCAISNVIGALDDRIDNLRQTNATLEAIAQALFKSWFVDFDGVPPEDMQESELGLIPKGWQVGRFAEAIDILGGGTPKTSIAEYWGGDIPWFSVVDAPTNGQVFVLDTDKKITALGLQNCSAKLLPEMTTVISARGTVGKVAMTGVPMAMNQSCYALRPKQQGGEAFVYFSTLRFVEQLQRIAHGAVFDTITRDSFKQVNACLAPDEVIAKFGKTVNPLLERVRANGQQAATLASLRDTVLPRLISGQLRVKQ